jgi:hypothetical protein
VRVDKDDNIWVVDEGSNMVIKFNLAGSSRPDHRPAAGSGRRTDQLSPVRAPRRNRTSRTRSIVRPTSAGTRRATSSSLTATAITAS